MMKTKFHPLDERYKYLQITIPQLQNDNNTNNDQNYLVIVTLNRPRKRNAISAAMWKEIGDVFHQLGTLGDDCRCIIVTGAGNHFSSGIDISDPSFFPNEEEQEWDVARRGMAFLPKIQEMQRCFTAIETCPVPVIAAIRGSCIGAGVDLICCCDIRLAQAGATFSVREVKLGLAADIGTLQRLPKITGNDSRVREVCFTGEAFGPEEAEKMGLVSRVIPHNCTKMEEDTVLAAAIRLGFAIASNSPIAVTGTKRSLVYSRDHSVAEGLEQIANHNSLALMTSDLQNAMVAALAKNDRSEFSRLPPFSRL